MREHKKFEHKQEGWPRFPRGATPRSVLPAAAEQEAARRPEVERLMAHPGVGSLTALPLVLIIGTPQ